MTSVRHGTLPSAPKVVPLGLGIPFKDPLRAYKGHTLTCLVISLSRVSV